MIHQETISQDSIVAEAFWARDDSADILESFRGNMDGELLNDIRKSGVYLHLRDQGIKHVWAAMTACRRGGRMIHSDGAFNEHARRRMNDMSPMMQEKILSQAHSAGISTQGKYYCGGIGGYTDPAAWVSTTDDILTACKLRNLTCEGSVRHQGHTEEPGAPVRLAEDLVQECMEDELAESPRLQERLKKNPEKESRRLRGLVIEKYGATT